MKTNKIIIFLISFGIIITIGCKKFLAHQPDDRTELNRPENVAELLVKAYPNGNYMTFAEAMSDNSVDEGTPGYAQENTYPWLYESEKLINPTAVDTPPYYWNQCYNAISAANHALEAIDKADNIPSYAASRGEALVCRAYAHFMLAIFFSKPYDSTTAESDPGIPYVTQPLKQAEGNYIRSTVANIYANIEKDLLEGIDLIDDNSYKMPKYHFTKKAAYAFASRFYLFKKNYQKVIDYANKAYPATSIIDNLRPWNTIYKSIGISEMWNAYVNSEDPGNVLLAKKKSNWGGIYVTYNYGFGAELLSIFKNNPSGKEFSITHKITRGWADDCLIPKFAYNVFPLFSSEEVLFNRAEANVMLGNNEEALLDINAYLSTRIDDYSPVADKFTLEKAISFFSTTDVKLALVQTILNFKRLEFMQEGLRWFDIIRTKIPIEHISFDKKTKITLAPNDPRRVLQIPQHALAVGLQPNPR